MNSSVILPEKWKDLAVIKEIGAGASGAVYLTRDPEGREYAVKVMLGENHLPDAFLLRQLADSPYIVRILDTASENGFCYLKMEYLKSFAEQMHQEAMAESQVIDRMMDVLRAVRFLEQHALLHRDIKPDNILLRPDGSCVLCDVDQARFTVGEGMTVQGSFSYMAPEVYWGKPYDSRADLYSVGMVFYRCVNRGRPPFTAMGKSLLHHQDMEKSLERRMKGELLPPPAEASEALSRILLRLCEPEPKDRYANAEQVIKDLEDLQKGKKNVRRGFFEGRRGRKRIIAAAAAAALLMLAGTGGWFVYRQSLPLVEETFPSQEGGSISYTIDHRGQAVFDGEGTADGLLADPKWMEEDRSLIKKLIIKGGIKSFSLSFADCSGLEEVVLEEGVESLAGMSLFANCTTLKHVTLPDTLRRIGDSTFVNCTALEEITLPKELSVIPANCFWLCSSLCRVSLPDGISKVGADAFTGTPWLDAMLEEDGYAAADHILLACADQGEVFTLPREWEISAIGDAAFRGHQELRSVTLPEGVTELGEYAFEQCYSLAEVHLPDTLEQIGRYAFNCCSSLEELIIPEQTDISAGDIFQETPYLSHVTDADGFAVVNHTLIRYTGAEEEVIIPDAYEITVIGKYAFWANRTMQKVTVPKSVALIRELAFFMCQNLAEVTFSGTVPKMGEGAFAGSVWQP